MSHDDEHHHHRQQQHARCSYIRRARRQSHSQAVALARGADAPPRSTRPQWTVGDRTQVVHCGSP
ncbi:hypothetical protein YT1_0255 [Rhodococcus ruber]|nr:hypothetical protein YT1_0255 [Rhodococcus ruber]